MNCGKPLPVQARFCRSCGAAQDTEDLDLQPQDLSLPSSPAFPSHTALTNQIDQTPTTPPAPQPPLQPPSQHVTRISDTVPNNEPQVKPGQQPSAYDALPRQTPRAAVPQAQPRSTTRSKSSSRPALMLVSVLVLLAIGAVIIWLLQNRPPTGPNVAGMWTKQTGDAIICCGDNIAVLPLGRSIEFREDGFVNINSGTFKYRWRDDTHLIIEYPLNDTVYDAKLGSDSTLHLEEQFTASTRFTYDLVRGVISKDTAAVPTIAVPTIALDPVSTPSPEARQTAQTESARISVDNAATLLEWKLLSAGAWQGYVSFSTDSKLVAYAGANGISVYDIEQGQLLNQWNGHSALVHNVAFSPDGSRLYSGGADAGGGRIRIWDWPSTSEITSVKCAIEPWGASLGLSADGQTLAASCAQEISLWDVTGNSLRQTQQLGRGETPVFSSQNWIGWWDNTGGLRLYQVDSGESRLLQAPIKSGYSPKVAFSPDGSLVATGTADNRVWLWNVEDSQKLWNSEPYDSPITSVAFSPEGHIVASGSDDGTVRLLRANDGSLLTILEGHRNIVVHIAFSTDGRMLASASLDGTVRLWRVP